MRIGKLTSSELQKYVFDKTVAKNPEILQSAGLAEDCAAQNFTSYDRSHHGDGQQCRSSCDNGVGKRRRGVGRHAFVLSSDDNRADDCICRRRR